MKITYEQLPEAAKQAYLKANKARKLTMFLCIAATILFLIAFLPNVKEMSFFGVIFGAIFAGSMLQGVVHALSITKSIYFKLKKHIISMIILAPVLLVIPLIPLCCFAEAGFVFEIIDIILFIQKKPLIYEIENSLFLDSKAVQEEIETAQQEELYRNIMQDLTSENPSQKMTQLRQMLEDGLITEEDYNQKKAELLKNM